ncbi:MAG: flagellar biosynthesis anti-sigma factor FlgM [Planctomycetia bacterium]|nr:flagellar biosynthesis anti-sigma factor FlgM [Planctomycetia bacterium]
MNIYGANVIGGSQPVSAPHQTKQTGNATGTQTSNASQTVIKDELEITGRPQMTAQSAELSGESTSIRFDRVNEARAKIASGLYDSPEYLEIALERMIERNFG